MPMKRNKKKTSYKAFGLNILSDVQLPELFKPDQEERVDIVIESSDLTELWYDLSGSQQKILTKKNLFMFQFPNVATYVVQDGKKIIVSSMGGADEDQVRLYILGTCMGALLMQRKILPLHGSAVAINGKAYAFVGEQGAGKSTLAAAFLERGYKLLSDDVIGVSLNEEGIPQVTPSYPQQKLWEDCLGHFDMETSHYRPLFERETKFSVPVHDQFLDKPLPLEGVFELVKKGNCSGKVELHPIQKLERLHTLFNHTYRNYLIQRFGLMEWHFQFLTRFVNKIDLAQLQRPESGFTANELLSIVLNQINRERLSV